MGRPFRVYCMSLVERLGFGTINNMYASMNANDISEWMAYDMIKNPEWYDKAIVEQDLKRQETDTFEEETRKMKLMFGGLN